MYLRSYFLLLNTYPVAVRAQERALRVCLRTRSGASNSAANSAPPMSPTEALGAAAPCRRVRRCGGHSHNRVHLRSHARHASSRLGRNVRGGTLARPRTAPSCLSLWPRATCDAACALRLCLCLLPCAVKNIVLTHKNSARRGTARYVSAAGSFCAACGLQAVTQAVM